jgi:hypothetical protein
MKTHAAVLWGREQDWKIEHDLDPSGRLETLVECSRPRHSDEHLQPSEMSSPARWSRRRARGQPASAGCGQIDQGHRDMFTGVSLRGGVTI